jgi:hypothetical protein
MMRRQHSRAKNRPTICVRDFLTRETKHAPAAAGAKTGEIRARAFDLARRCVFVLFIHRVMFLDLGIVRRNNR